MSKTSAKDTTPARQFAASLKSWFDLSEKNNEEAAAFLGVSPSSLSEYLRGKKPCSFGKMIVISEKIEKELVDMLLEGRVLLAGEATPASEIPPSALEALKEAHVAHIDTLEKKNAEALTRLEKEVEFHKSNAERLKRDLELWNVPISEDNHGENGGDHY